MSLKIFVQHGIRMSYCECCMMPEIPEVQDVLYALQLSKEQAYYDVCLANHEVYIANVYLVAAAIGFDATTMRPYDEPAARKLIAQAIVELCPDHARCLFVHAYVAAKQLAGDQVPEGLDGDRLREACRCRRCHNQLVESRCRD